ncbi:MAG: diadenylate cyclase CdaA [Kiritimatiellia bacterium]|nr:diadenylate cyclase CdaA [Lentisphaerota bacterium]
MNPFNRLIFPDGSGWIEIACLTFLFYYALYFFRGTRGAPALTGFGMIFITMIVVTRFLHLDALNWLLGRFSVYLAVAFLVLFQPEIRRVLAELGKQHFFTGAVEDRDVIDSIVEAATILSRRKIGALIAVERAIGMRAIMETGVAVDCRISTEILASIFFPYTPLHDGGVIISGSRLSAARCVFPLSMREEFSNMLGTRHRAAVGLTEETDAVVVVVSEESGGISLSREGHLLQNLEPEKLQRLLTGVLSRPPPALHRWQKWRKKLSRSAAAKERV